MGEEQWKKEKIDMEKAFDNLKDDYNSLEKDRMSIENERDENDDELILLKKEFKTIEQQLNEANQVNEDHVTTITNLMSVNEKIKLEEEKIQRQFLRIQELEATVEDLKLKENTYKTVLDETSQKHSDIKKKRTQEALTIG